MGKIYNSVTELIGGTPLLKVTLDQRADNRQAE